MVKNREYKCSVTKYNRPQELEGSAAIAYRLIELISMNPGDNPLHPEMGVGIHSFRYSVNTLNELEAKVREQLATYLPMYQVTDIALIVSPDKILNIEIGIGDTTYVYDSQELGKPITIDDL